MSCYLIKNPNVVNEGKCFVADVLIKSGKIAQIGNSLSTTNNTIVIDGENYYLLPGMIDDQVHFREPGLTHKGNIESESRAAVMGGITSYMEMPNCNPPTLSIECLVEKKNIASKKSHANFAFYLGASNSNDSELLRLRPNDACGVKIFMGASTGNMLVDNINVLEIFFKSSPILIATHCEDTSIIIENEKKFYKKYGDNLSIVYHPDIRSRQACLKSSSLAVSLAKKYRSKLHVLHLTTADELELFDREKSLQAKRITTEVCAHHLFFSENDYKTKGNLIKCNPAIKKESDRLALLEAVNNDVIDIIATDHAPHTWAEKQNSYINAPAGMPLVQHALISLLEHYHKGMISLEKIVYKTAHAPAIVYQIEGRGFIREGYWADLVLVNLCAKSTINHTNAKYKCGWSPFHGLTFSSRIEKTFVNGILKYSHNKIVSDKTGQSLTFNHTW